ncbi:MAG: hypothetical protein GX660_13010 [Clostridiaceae bacterium]|nr:hypothetical protein [Clostridiaceae bacterium]
MEDYIMSIIKDVLNGVGTIGSGVILKSPEAYNKTLYDGVVSIMQNAVMPVAYVILGLLFMLELYNITIRTEGMSNSGFEIPFKAMFKIAICKIFIDSTPLVMGAIFAISTTVISNIGGVFGSGSVSMAANFDAMEASLRGMNFAAKLLLSTQVTLIWLIFKFSTLVISVIIVGRMVEIYIYLAISPLPLATIPNGEINSVAKNFLKSFAAVSIQGVLIFIVLALYGTLIGSIASKSAFIDITTAMLEATLYSLVLVVCIFMTGRWSKSICNAM